jgi:hypothetical protein
MFTKISLKSTRPRNIGIAAPCLTVHALIRRQERFKISVDELVDQLAAGLFVHLGKQADGKVHRLFYSRDDGGWGVAIQDKKTGAVVTVLTLEFFANCQRKVKPFEKRRAKELVHWRRRHLDFDHALVQSDSNVNNEEDLLVAA